ncbi:uncharacterized protein LOC144866254 [Branchiostoma floridae x Branchiostoma japonicum]
MSYEDPPSTCHPPENKGEKAPARPQHCPQRIQQETASKKRKRPSKGGVRRQGTATAPPHRQRPQKLQTRSVGEKGKTRSVGKEGTASEHTRPRTQAARRKEEPSGRLHKKARARPRRFDLQKAIQEKRKRRKERKREERRRTLLEAARETVVNLSGLPLADIDILALSKGLNFSPSPTDLNRQQLIEDLHAFFRRLRLRELFADQDKMETQKFKVKSKWTPPTHRDPALDTFIMAVEKEILEHKEPSPRLFKTNITDAERTALAELSRRTDIIIKPADKGSAVVIMKREDYIQEALRQLSNKDHYKNIDSCPTEEHAALVRTTLLKLLNEGSISEEEFNYLAPIHPRTPVFYLLPKIHKEGNPGRPIISANDCATERISEFADHHLRPLVQKLPSYIKDTTDFLQKLNILGKISPTAKLVTLDVSSLYTNIPTEEGIQACREALQKNPSDVPTEAICDLLDRILNLNNFEFNGGHYIQVQGTAMGTRVAPSYANIFMGKFEEQHVYTRNLKPLIWWRYIDDIFAIWTHSEEDFHSFIRDLNTAHPTIKFTVETSTTSINFLDVTINVSEGVFTTDLYTKPTDKHQYLLRNSSHPTHCKRGIPFGQFLRVRRICSDEPKYRERAQQLKGFFQKRGYEDALLDEAAQRALHRPREELLRGQKKKRATPQDRPVLVTTYNPHLPPVNNILRKYWNILQLSPRTRELFKDPPLVAYRRNKNLKDTLVRAQIPKENNNFITKNIPSGSYPCGRKCLTCTYVKKSKAFHSHQTSIRYTIRAHITCRTRNIIYMIQCKKCGIQYVGETGQTLANRMNGHRSSIKTDKDTPISAHFNQPSHTVADMEVIGLEKLAYGRTEDLTRQRRLHRESYWIHQLRTLHPEGLNQESLEITRV